MVHADASNFASGVTKDEAYEQVLLQAKGLFADQRNWVRERLSADTYLNASTDGDRFGFYVLDPSSKDPQLILGPFQGKVACQTIKFGRGICGTAAASRETQLVDDVDRFPGHIACDGDSRSEIVVPVLADDRDGSGTRAVVAIIDVDCATLGGFDESDKRYLQQLAELLSRSCDW
ncbi:GAF domain-containing protein [Hirsutella rhossiliensis]